MECADVLRPLSEKELLDFIDTLKDHFPKTLRPHHYLLMHYRLKTSALKQKQDFIVSSRFRCEFYAHKNGNRKNCTFIALSDDRPSKYEEDYSIFIFSLEQDNKELEECLQNTKRIKWELNPLIFNIQSGNCPVIMNFIKENNFGIEWSAHDNCLWLSKDEAQRLNIGTVPDNVKIARIRAEDADLINDVWPHKSGDSDIYIRTQIILNGGWGIYDKENDRLLSWIITTDNFSPGSVQTLDSEKRKGYAELLLRAYCKDFAETEDLDVIAFVIVTNQASGRLFRKVGFTDFDQCYYIKIQYK